MDIQKMLASYVFGTAELKIGFRKYHISSIIKRNQWTSGFERVTQIYTLAYWVGAYDAICEDF